MQTPLFVSPALHNLYSSKITLEYQLPSSSQKLSTTNECIVSVLSGLTLTALQVGQYFISTTSLVLTLLVFYEVG